MVEAAVGAGNKIGGNKIGARLVVSIFARKKFEIGRTENSNPKFQNLKLDSVKSGPDSLLSKLVGDSAMDPLFLREKAFEIGI